MTHFPLQEGAEISWPFSFSAKDLEAFAILSGDNNPIHMDPVYAKSRGFSGPLIYGLLLSSQLSRLIGQELPSLNSILTGIEMDFISPAYVNDDLMFAAILIMKSDATNAIEFKCRISRADQTICKGKATAIWLP